MEIRALRPSDDRSTFRSGDADLDRYFHRFAGQNQFKHHLGVSHVAVEDDRILGFATVSPAQLEIENLPAAAQRRLPRYPVLVLRVARLAVDESARRMGLGSQLLRFALHLAQQMAEDYGCAGVVVDAKPDAVSFYARYGFISMEALEGQSESRPEPVPMFLSMRAIRLSPGRRRPE